MGRKIAVTTHDLTNYPVYVKKHLTLKVCEVLQSPTFYTIGDSIAIKTGRYERADLTRNGIHYSLIPPTRK